MVWSDKIDVRFCNFAIFISSCVSSALYDWFCNDNVWGSDCFGCFWLFSTYLCDLLLVFIHWSQTDLIWPVLVLSDLTSLLLLVSRLIWSDLTRLWWLFRLRSLFLLLSSLLTFFVVPFWVTCFDLSFNHLFCLGPRLSWSDLTRFWWLFRLRVFVIVVIESFLTFLWPFVVR